MAATAAIFHSLDLLEKEFDKAFVDLDVLLSDTEYEETEEIIVEARDKMNTLSSCFSQLCHKTQSTAQKNAKLEAEAVNMREELLTARADFETAQHETSSLVRQLHALQLQLHSVRNGGVDVDSAGIKEKLDNEMEEFRSEIRGQALLKEEVFTLKQENLALSKRIAALESELYGARLAAKYLDKELAGRIQQIQLLGRKIKPPNFEKMWHQLEAEIHLHRHKTVIKACRRATKLPYPQQEKSLDHRRHGVGEVRQVVVKKSPEEGLGISITGGREHGVPVLISEIHDGAVVDRNGGLYVGDAVLSVNGHDLRHVKHQEAVALLSQQLDTLTLEVVYVNADEDVDEEELTYGVEVAGENDAAHIEDAHTNNQEQTMQQSSPSDTVARNRSASISDESVTLSTNENSLVTLPKLTDSHGSVSRSSESDR
ncbi:Golgi-associated PDZ and coiled-coil motif-containing protein-like isoform X1 [Clavelina lepadiformis]|uniref:Golgi-associated PDZ and coiled-coil motif-containing protein-like isoform X1 n=2 Tax=Clavelina lepadiformis TaxID=159417 RepID=UPI004042BF62